MGMFIFGGIVMFVIIATLVGNRVLHDMDGFIEDIKDVHERFKRG